MTQRAFAFALLLVAAACGDNIPPENEPPVPRTPSFSITLLEDGTVQLDATAVDPEGREVSYSHTAPSHGTLMGTGPLFFYTGGLDYFGQDSFELQASDGARSVVMPVVLTIGAVNDAPLVAAQAVATAESQPIGFTLTATDVDSTALTFSVATQPAHGTLTGTPPDLTYMPDQFYFGTDTFTYTASDGIDPSAPATVTLAISNVIVCGDGQREGDEGCDDGNDVDTDACRNSCISSTCGDGVVQDGVEQCDDDNDVDTDACRNNCMIAICGDGAVRDDVEECDDGNSIDNDACRNSCVDARCGDSVVYDGVEQCDDANDLNNDSCLDSCMDASCGDGFTWAGVEDCDDANPDDTDACRNDCTAPACGDGRLDTGEECDDGDLDDDDGCGHSCLIERCGDRLIQLPAGETCDDGNLVDNDGCDAACHVEAFQTTVPVLISGGEACNTAVANSARKISLDSSGRIYAVMTCSGVAKISISTNRGVSFVGPTDLSSVIGTPEAPAVVLQVAVANGPSGVTYVAMILNNGQVHLRITEDAGATWGPAVQIGQTTNPGSGLSLQAFNDDLYIGFAIGGGIAAARNDNRGNGPFQITDVAMAVAFFDLLYDITLGTLAVVADTPAFHVRVSSDGGSTFATEVNPPGQSFFSDWAIGNGTIFVSGTFAGSDSLYQIPSTNPSTSTRISGLPTVGPSPVRSLASDAVGNAFVASQLDNGNIQLDRLGAGAGAFDPPRTLAISGSAPTVSGLPGSSGAAVVFTQGTDVFATVQVY